MSRIGRAPIPIPAGVTVDIKPGLVSISGPKGTLSRQVSQDMGICMESDQLIVTRPTDNRLHKSMHGLTRTLLANMVTGVSTGFEKKMELYGVGYRVQLQDTKIALQLGYSHPVEIEPPAGISFAKPESFTPTSANEWLSARFSILGIDKEVVGQLAAKIRGLRPMDPYKGKGFKYLGQRVRRKAGKSGKTGAKGKGGR